ncbi:hypothetical protein [Prosthecochloris aestuarii]|nr:hypothetical protein [Prosthecochloris aestuarii]
MKKKSTTKNSLLARYCSPCLSVKTSLSQVIYYTCLCMPENQQLNDPEETETMHSNYDQVDFAALLLSGKHDVATEIAGYPDLLPEGPDILISLPFGEGKTGVQADTEAMIRQRFEKEYLARFAFKPDSTCIEVVNIGIEVLRKMPVRNRKEKKGSGPERKYRRQCDLAV